MRCDSLTFRKRKRRDLLILLFICMDILLFSRAGADRTPRYTALLIGQSYSSSEELSAMPGCLQDVRDLRKMLEGMNRTPYEITVRTDLTAEGIRDAVTESFRDAEKNDVCLFYYAGHGQAAENASERGALVGTDGKTVPLDELCGILAETKGQVVVILDSCYSGSILPFLPEAERNSSLMSIHALCAAGPCDRTDDITANGDSYGAFTRNLVLGSDPDTMPADRSGDGAVSLTEAYYFTKSHARSSDKKPVIYPEDSGIILWGKK